MTKNEREALLKERFAEMTRLERELWAKGVRHIAGVDEVGRGPLAGPVVAAAVVLPKDFSILGVNDSKKLSAKKRDQFYDLIMGSALAVGLGSEDNETIDRVNILEATKLAMKTAVAEAEKLLRASAGGSERIGHILVDALTLPGLDAPQAGIVKGDEKSISIAAASIIAKVTRDRLMADYHKIYPAYAFDRNKGYGTKEHYSGLAAAGLCPIHRRSFCGNL